MKLSCVCLTYGRPDCLAEAVASFLWQTYPDKELVILNDHPQQTIVCDAPGVVVVNLPVRMRTLGEKYNAGYSLTSGDVILPWDDDDIYLPHRLALTAQRMQETGKPYYKNPNAWFWNNGALTGPCRNLHFCSGAWRRDLYEQTHGHAIINAPADSSLEAQFSGMPDTQCVEPPDADPALIYYVYRWGGIPAHGSQYGGDDRTVMSRATADLQRRQEFAAGTIHLVPAFRQDYPALVREAMA